MQLKPLANPRVTARLACTRHGDASFASCRDLTLRGEMLQVSHIMTSQSELQPFLVCSHLIMCSGTNNNQ